MGVELTKSKFSLKMQLSELVKVAEMMVLIDRSEIAKIVEKPGE